MVVVIVTAAVRVVVVISRGGDGKVFGVLVV